MHVEFKLNEDAWSRTSDVGNETTAATTSIRVSLTKLVSRVHTLQVRSPCARESVTLSHTWEIDVTPPNTTISADISNFYRRDKTLNDLSLSCSEAGCGFRYAVDDQPVSVLGVTGASWLEPDTQIVSHTAPSITTNQRALLLVFEASRSGAEFLVEVVVNDRNKAQSENGTVLMDTVTLPCETFGSLGCRKEFLLTSMEAGREYTVRARARFGLLVDKTPAMLVVHSIGSDVNEGGAPHTGIARIAHGQRQVTFQLSPVSKNISFESTLDGRSPIDLVAKAK